MWNWILLIAVIAVGYYMVIYMKAYNEKKTASNKETFEEAASDIKKLVNHLDAVSKDFSDTVAKLKAVTDAAATGAGAGAGAGAAASKAAAAVASSPPVAAKGSKKTQDTFAGKRAAAASASASKSEEEDDDNEKEGFENRRSSVGMRESFAKSSNNSRMDRSNHQESLVNGVSSKMTGNYMLL